MFRKFLIFAMFATAAGYCFASDSDMPQIVTSEVFYETTEPAEYVIEQQPQYVEYEYEYAAPMPTPAPVVEYEYVQIPTWPIAGTDADVYVSCEGGAAECSNKKSTDDNIRIVSKIGDDLVVENNFNMGGVRGDFGGWSGGANMLHGRQVPAGFLDECEDGAEMPLLRREMLEDDGGTVLTVSRSNRKRCGGEYAGYDKLVASGAVVDADADAGSSDAFGVDVSADAEAPRELSDQVRSWVVASGQTLRDVLQNWSDKEGWDLVWATAREYPIEASAVFKGRFVDVASALVRNFGRATPVPYAKFYKGNRVLVISTLDE